MRRLVNTALVAGIQILVVVLAALAFNLAEPTAAHAEQVEAPDHKVDTARVTYAEFHPSRPLLYVELNDGSTWRLRPCRVEDGRHCFWVSTRGNGIGRSWIVVRGTRIFTNRI